MDPFNFDPMGMAPNPPDPDATPGWISETIESRPQYYHSHTFILLHDCMSCNRTFKKDLQDALSPITRTKVFPSAKFILPNAPWAINDDASTRAWFSVADINNDDCHATPENWQEVASAAASLHQIVLQESLVVGPQNVFVGGCGMGAAVVFAMLLMSEVPLGGVFSVGGWMPFVDDVKRISAGSQTRVERERAHVVEAAEMTGIKVEEAVMIDPLLLEATTETQKTTAQENAGEGATKTKYPAQGPEIWLNRVTAFLRRLVLPDATGPNTSNTPIATPILLYHHENDPVVPVQHSKETQAALTNMGFRVFLKRVTKDYHDIDLETFEDILQEIVNRSISDPELRGQISMSFSENHVPANRRAAQQPKREAQPPVVQPLMAQPQGDEGNSVDALPMSTPTSPADPKKARWEQLEDPGFGDQYAAYLLSHMQGFSTGEVP